MILENSDIDKIICLNKCDLKTQKDEEVIDIYKNTGIKVIETSTVNNIGISELKENMMKKQAIFVGNSGVGKSSLINSLVEESAIKTGSVSCKSKRVIILHHLQNIMYGI